jgi:hypothetical protein
MGHLSLTLWFTVATLFGPSLLCCCPPATAAAPIAVAAPKPVKSCCNHDSAPTDPKPVSAPKEKPKCPCQAKASADALSDAVETSDEVAAQIRTADVAFAELSAIPFEAIRSHDTVAVQSLRTPPPLSGRALLAAYSTLRC